MRRAKYACLFAPQDDGAFSAEGNLPALADSTDDEEVLPAAADAFNGGAYPTPHKVVAAAVDNAA